MSPIVHLKQRSKLPSPHSRSITITRNSASTDSGAPPTHPPIIDLKQRRKESSTMADAASFKGEEMSKMSLLFGVWDGAGEGHWKELDERGRKGREGGKAGREGGATEEGGVHFRMLRPAPSLAPPPPHPPPRHAPLYLPLIISATFTHVMLPCAEAPRSRSSITTASSTWRVSELARSPSRSWCSCAQAKDGGRQEAGGVVRVGWQAAVRVGSRAGVLGRRRGRAGAAADGRADDAPGAAAPPVPRQTWTGRRG